MHDLVLLSLQATVGCSALSGYIPAFLVLCNISSNFPFQLLPIPGAHFPPCSRVSSFLPFGAQLKYLPTQRDLSEPIEIFKRFPPLFSISNLCFYPIFNYFSALKNFCVCLPSQNVNTLTTFSVLVPGICSVLSTVRLRTAVISSVFFPLASLPFSSKS